MGAIIFLTVSALSDV